MSKELKSIEADEERIAAGRRGGGMSGALKINAGNVATDIIRRIGEPAVDVCCVRHLLGGTCGCDDDPAKGIVCGTEEDMRSNVRDILPREDLKILVTQMLEHNANAKVAQFPFAHGDGLGEVLFIGRVKESA